MTTTRELCRAVATALQVPGVELHAARLVRDGLLPRFGDEDDAAPTPAARRQRRHRARRKQGRFVVPVEVTCEMVEALFKRGGLDEAGDFEVESVGEAIGAAARRDLDLD